MSDHAPITTDLRRAARRFSKFTDLSIEHVELEAGRFDELCDAIDAVHAALEDENDRLREDRSIGSATITITPTLDWMAMATELRAIADILAGDAR